MTLAQTKLLVPKTFPSKRDADSSIASVHMPLTKTVAYSKYGRISQSQAGFRAPGQRVSNVVIHPEVQVGDSEQLQ